MLGIRTSAGRIEVSDNHLNIVHAATGRRKGATAGMARLSLREHRPLPQTLEVSAETATAGEVDLVEDRRRRARARAASLAGGRARRASSGETAGGAVSKARTGTGARATGAEVMHRARVPPAESHLT